MPKKILISDVGGSPSGFLLAAVLAVLCLVASVFVATNLASMQSFGEIAVPSSVALLCAFFAGLVAVATSHALSDESDSRL
jgi:hypothetical protein